MQKNNHMKESSKVDETGVTVRPKLKLSDLNQENIKDIDSMFGVWFEVDHCD